MLRNIDIDLVYQPTIPGPPAQDLYQQACAGDAGTVGFWKDRWIANYRSANDKFGDFGERSMGNLFGINRHKAAIVIGSGPSLKYALDALRENKSRVNPVLTVSALHNFGLFEDEDCHADYYVSLDAGEIVMKDVSEGRKHASDYYWEKTKGKTLIAYTSSHPDLWEKWQGDVYLFNSLIPDMSIRKAIEDIQPFSHYVSSGGNCTGAAMYIAKAVMASSTIMFVGLDLCFGYDNTFHSYKTSYDSVGQYITVTDVFGNMRKTWRSYWGFKCWFDHTVCNVPGIWFNCSEGILGAYKEGNIAQFKYMDLKSALIPYESADTLYLKDLRDGSKEPFDLKEFWSNPRQDKPLVFF